MFKGRIPNKLEIIEKTNDGMWCSEVLPDGSLSPDKIFLGNEKQEDKYTLIRAMWKNAHTQFKAAMIIFDQTKHDPAFLLSSAILASFSCELFLKSLLLHAGYSKKGHDLQELFETLPLNIKDIILKGVGNQISLAVFYEQLSQNKMIFENARYMHEKTCLEFNANFLCAFATTLDAIATSLLEIPPSAL